MGAGGRLGADQFQMLGHPLPDRRLRSNLPRGAWVSALGMTKPAPLPSAGQVAPKMYAHLVR